MASQNGNPKTNLVTNVLLGIITILLIALIVLFVIAQMSEASQRSAEAANREALINQISQISQENQTAIDDLYNDYTRDRGYIVEEEENYLLKRSIVGDEYVIHGLMFLAKQNNQILELLAEMQ